MVPLCLLLGLGLSTVQSQTLSAHPLTPEEFAQALQLREVQLAQAEGLQLWCEDRKQFQRLEKPVLQAWQTLNQWLGGVHLPEGITVRVVVLREEDAIRSYPRLLEAEAKSLQIPLPGVPFLDGVIHSGSGTWGYPPMALIYGKILHKDQLLTRVLHEMGTLRARFAACPYGAEPPEFLKEGLAGMLMRHEMKKPAALVSHKGAALTETVHGYGVFAAVGAIANDSSNLPSNWPSVLRQGVKAMRKEKSLDESSRVDALLQRDSRGFARTDYAYAWAAIEFLMDPFMPYGEAALEAMESRKWKPGKEPLENSRRDIFLKSLADLRRPEFATLDAVSRGQQLRGFLLDGYGESPEQMHEAFMFWVEKRMPKK